MVSENEQPGKAENVNIVDVCCQRVSETYGKPDSDKWTNGDFVNLSNILFRQTRVRISPNTLKRIFGKIKTDARYYPQKATRDALANYTGYGSWAQFVQAQEQAGQPSELTAYVPSSQPVPRSLATQERHISVTNWPNYWLLCGLFVAVGLLAGFLWVRNRAEESETASLICRNPLGENPHSAVFALRYSGISDLTATPFIVHFGDGKYQRLAPTDTVFTHYYERPGRYFTILQRDGQNIDTATVYLQTKGWTVTADMARDTTRVYPVNVPNLFSDGHRSVSTLQVAQAGIDTNQTFFMQFINSHPSSINGDNFELTARLKTSPDRAGVRCSQVGITVWGESSQHLVEVMKPGCVRWIELQLSEQRTSGRSADLSFLGADLRMGGTLRLQVVNQIARIFINGRKVHEAQYAKPLRRVYGVSLRLSGIGIIDSFWLEDRETGKVFDGSFSSTKSNA